METIIGTDIQHAAALLGRNEVVAIPTETVYGLAANALNEEATSKVYSTKQRPTSNPLIVHIPDASHLEVYATSVPEVAKSLAAHFWPGSLTMILPKKSIVPDSTTAGQSTVALRVPNHPVTLQLLSAIDFPLAAPSANPFNYISPTKAEHVKMQLDGKIEYILDGGTCTAGIESTIIGFKDEQVILYRPGAVSKEAIEAFLGFEIISNKPATDNTMAPGMFKKHYSPKTPLILTNNVAAIARSYNPTTTGVITLQTVISGIPKAQQIQLSPSSNLEEAAHNLYESMIQLDQMNLEIIIAEKMPEEGIGIAMNDRLVKAASRVV